MLTDDQLIDNVNPFVVDEFSMPGTWSEAMSYGKYGNPVKDDSEPPCSIEASCDTKHSPICDYGITAGDNTIAMCRPGTPNCAMNRRLVPERNIEDGRWSLPVKITAKQGNPIVGSSCIGICMMIILLMVMTKVR